MGLLLTVIVPTIPRRASMLSRLLHGLNEQPDERAEVLVVDGVGQLGDKVNAGLRAARGRLSVIVDDDDELASDYVPTVCDVIAAEEPDYVGYHIGYVHDGRWARTITHRLDGDPQWRVEPRGVGPKCPFATEAGRLVPFANDYTADRRWSIAVSRKLERGAFISRHLYRYDFRTTGSVFVGSGDGGDVGQWPYNPDAFRWMSEETIT